MEKKSQRFVIHGNNICHDDVVDVKNLALIHVHCNYCTITPNLAKNLQCSCSAVHTQEHLHVMLHATVVEEYARRHLRRLRIIKPFTDPAD